MDKKRAWFIAILFFSGLCLTLYPFVSNLIAQSHASQAIAAYDEQVAEMDQEQIDAAKEAVRKYNEQLNAAVEASAMQGEDGISYLDLVDVGESIGFIEIPKIDVYLPIYSGTNEDVLQKGVGHLAESSYRRYKHPFRADRSSWTAQCGFVHGSGQAGGGRCVLSPCIG